MGSQETGVRRKQHSGPVGTNENRILVFDGHNGNQARLRLDIPAGYGESGDRRQESGERKHSGPVGTNENRILVSMGITVTNWF
jgi:hypothetical protein